mgnify:FL=1|jgi:hypothetical protein|tara:strand:+ start:470 stop:1228 length:759 start_codon:yes stop_codon:yes gene_type:complete
MQKFTLSNVIGGDLGVQARILALQTFNFWANVKVSSSPILKVRSVKHESTDASNISLDTFRDLIQLPESESPDDKRERLALELDANLSVANSAYILAHQIEEPEYAYHVSKVKQPAEAIYHSARYNAVNNTRSQEISATLSAITAIDTSEAKKANKLREDKNLEENIRYQLTELASVDNRDELISFETSALEDVLLNSDLNNNDLLDRFESSVKQIVTSLAKKANFKVDPELVLYGNSLLLADNANKAKANK